MFSLCLRLLAVVLPLALLAAGGASADPRPNAAASIDAVAVVTDPVGLLEHPVWSAAEKAGQSLTLRLPGISTAQVTLTSDREPEASTIFLDPEQERAGLIELDLTTIDAAPPGLTKTITIVFCDD